MKGVESLRGCDNLETWPLFSFEKDAICRFRCRRSDRSRGLPRSARSSAQSSEPFRSRPRPTIFFTPRRADGYRRQAQPDRSRHGMFTPRAAAYCVPTTIRHSLQAGRLALGQSSTAPTGVFAAATRLPGGPFSTCTFADRNHPGPAPSPDGQTPERQPRARHHIGEINPHRGRWCAIS